MERFQRNLQYLQGEVDPRYDTGRLRLGAHAPNIDIVSHFQAGNGPHELVLENSGRTEIIHRHRSGFKDRKVKIMSLGAHPDDHALAAGFDHVLLKATNPHVDLKTAQAHELESGLMVVTATPGQEGRGDSGSRVQQDKVGTGILGADLVHNLGFYDGQLSNEQSDLTKRFAQFFEEYRPDIVIVPPPDDTVHPDHTAVQKTAIEALQLVGIKPIVIWTDAQAGKNLPEEGKGRSVGYTLTPEENAVYLAAYEAHETEMVKSQDIIDVKSRTIIRADQMGIQSFAGVVRQDMSFSQQPIEDFLGEKSIYIPNQGEIEEVVYRRL